jgi:hypothetical protein
VLLRLLKQVMQLGSRQNVLDLDRGHPCNLASCHEVRTPKPLFASRIRRMHDNGRYVKLRHEGCDGGFHPGHLGWTKKIRRAGLRFVHRFR